MDFTGNIEQNWKNWRQWLSFFLLATGKANDKDETKIAILYTLIGNDGLNIYITFDPKKISNDKNVPIFTRVVEEFDDYCNGKKMLCLKDTCFLSTDEKKAKRLWIL